MRWIRILVVAGTAFLWLAQEHASAQAEGEDCAVSPDLLVVNYPLNHVYDRLKAKQPVNIVIVGSTSSAGHGPQSPYQPFPRLLEAQLAKRLPNARFPLIIKSAPGLTAVMVGERLDKDVISSHPDLVVWEAGTTDAVQEVDINDFGDAITAGLRKLHGLSIDVILVDLQYSPQTSALYNFQPYLEYLWRIGEAEDANVLHRFEIMHSYVDDGRFVPGTTTTADQLKNASFVHTCLAHLLAEMIATAAQQP
jgi:hypothetical protein